eukprot:UN08074
MRFCYELVIQLSRFKYVGTQVKKLNTSSIFLNCLVNNILSCFSKCEKVTIFNRGSRNPREMFL